jgi:hypothetical protein
MAAHKARLAAAHASSAAPADKPEAELRALRAAEEAQECLTRLADRLALKQAQKPQASGIDPSEIRPSRATEILRVGQPSDFFDHPQRQADGHYRIPSGPWGPRLVGCFVTMSSGIPKILRASRSSALSAPAVGAGRGCVCVKRVGQHRPSPIPTNSEAAPIGRLTSVWPRRLPPAGTTQPDQHSKFSSAGRAKVFMRSSSRL